MERCRSNLFWFTFLAAIYESLALQCGPWICTDAGAYCCGDDCCYPVWGFWWFWTIWVVVFIVLTACGFCCRQRRRRLRQVDYIVVQGQPNNLYQPVGPVYGAVTTNVPHQPGVVGGHAAPNTFVTTPVPPAYTPATKPPEYSAVAPN